MWTNFKHKTNSMCHNNLYYKCMHTQQSVISVGMRPSVAYWPRHSECCNQNLGCLVLSWFLVASKGYMIEIDRPCQTSSLYEEHNIKYVAMGQCIFLLGLWRVRMDLPWMWNGVFLQLAVTTTPFCQRQRHPHYYSLLCSMVQNIADFLSCRIVLYVFLTDRYIG